jgi:hypothetical protein
VNWARPLEWFEQQWFGKARGVHTLQPVGYMDTVILHSLLVWIREGIDDEEDENVEPEDGNEFEALNDNICHIIVRHDLVHGMGEEDARVVVRKFRYTACQSVNALRGEASQDVFGLSVSLHLPNTQFVMRFIHRVLPFAI